MPLAVIVSGIIIRIIFSSRIEIVIFDRVFFDNNVFVNLFYLGLDFFYRAPIEGHGLNQTSIKVSSSQFELIDARFFQVFLQQFFGSFRIVQRVSKGPGAPRGRRLLVGWYKFACNPMGSTLGPGATISIFFSPNFTWTGRDAKTFGSRG